MEEKEIEINNIQNEILLIGSFYSKPDLYVEYGQYIKSKYDFDDNVTKFFYDNFELMYKTFSQNFNETQINTFMSQSKERLKLYRLYGGYKIIKEWIQLTDVDSFKNYFDIVKKYSLLREYHRRGFDVNKIIKHPKFNLFKAEDICKMIRAKADKISTVILNNNESIILNSEIQNSLTKWLIKPQMGLPLPWGLVNEMFRGCRLGKMVCLGFLSNEGKTRVLIKLIAYISLVKKEKTLLLANEMDEEDLRSCLITTVLNNPEFKELHGIDIYKPEKEVVLGQYRNDKGDFIERMRDDKGNFIELEEEYIQRVAKESKEFNLVQEVAKWVDDEKQKSIFFKDVSNDYSDKTLEFEFRKHNIVHGIKYTFYDTLKGYRIDDWQTIKQTTTKIKELMNQIKCFNFSNIQLTDDSVFTDIFNFSSSNIANAKQLKHVLDHLILGKRLSKEDYFKYEYIPENFWGDPTPQKLDVNKTYYAWKIDKNRGGSKDKIPLLEVNLDLNTWKEVGYIIKSGKWKG